MPRRLVKDQLAQDDLIGIWVYSSRHWGEAQAACPLDAIELGLVALCDAPEKGRLRDEIRSGYWSVTIGRHVLFYSFTSSELRLRRVLPAAAGPAS